MLNILILQKEHPERIRKMNKNLVKYFTNPEEITEEDKQFITDLDYNGIEFPVQEKIFNNFSNLGFRLKV